MKKLFFAAAWLILAAMSVQCTGKPDDGIEGRIDALLSQMTLEEKIGQMNQLSFDGSFAEGALTEAIRTGSVGSLLNITDPVAINALQKVAVEESRLGIPLVMGRDVIHGFRTIFPIPIGQAATFNPAIVEQGAAVAAREARSVGIHWTFAPMLDISRDQRWGRLAEGLGEDPVLGAMMGSAMVRGFQGTSLADPASIAACVKHFVAYGAAEGGRDYNSTNVPPHLMRNVYLVPFKAAIDAGAATLMTSFNDNDGIPGTGNQALLRDMLRDEWGWDGMVVSDWASVTEMISHGFAADAKEAAARAVNAGVDMEMVSGSYLVHLPALIEEGKVSMEYVDNSVRNILRLKFRLGLFENPYTDTSAPSPLYAPEHLAAAKEAAVQSAVLLKNDGVLPLAGVRTLAVVGPMADAPHDQLGTWIFDGQKSHTVTPLTALREAAVAGEFNIIHEPGVAYSRDRSTEGIAKAVSAARRADVVVAFVGEEAILSGEAHSLANPGLQGAQKQLVAELAKTGRPLVLVVMAGRPLTIGDEVAVSGAVLYSFHPGTMGGPALVDLLTGVASPSGRLPMSFAKEAGQIPIYYNHNITGRPYRGDETMIDDIALEAGQTSLGNSSYYLDAGAAPLFPFGFGLTYSTFEYSGLALSAEKMNAAGSVTASATITNTGSKEATEVVQLYVRDVAGSIARPVKELKDFRRVTLAPGASTVVEFTIVPDQLAFYGIDMVRRAEPGEFRLWIGPNSAEGMETKFVLE
ncbi:MAG: beta-glucosidase BglX [Alistipes sp.]|jgi:beta-glucosidase|nr:beta-glucosidase BglX [Alistipes sp.]